MFIIYSKCWAITVYHIYIYFHVWIILYVSPRTSVFLPRASPGASWDFDHRDVQGGALGSCCSSSWAETLPLPLGARGNWRESPSENKVPMEKTENLRILHLYVELKWELIRFWSLVLVRTMIVTMDSRSGMTRTWHILTMKDSYHVGRDSCRWIVSYHSMIWAEQMIIADVR